MKKYFNQLKFDELIDICNSVLGPFNNLFRGVWLFYQKKGFLPKIDTQKAKSLFYNPDRSVHSLVCRNLSERGTEIWNLPSIIDVRELVSKSHFGWSGNRRLNKLDEFLDFAWFDFHKKGISFGERGKNLIREYCTHELNDTEFEIITKLERLQNTSNDLLYQLRSANIIKLRPDQFLIFDQATGYTLDQRKLKIILK